MIEYTIHLEDANAAPFLFKECGFTIGKVVEKSGFSTLKVFTEEKASIVILKALVECPVCGDQRAFISTEMGKDLIV